MGMLGRYIDGLTEEQKDRVIEAQNWCSNVGLNEHGERCLVGHVHNFLADVLMVLAVFDEYWTVGPWFDALVSRYSKDHIVRAIKARAAKSHQISLSAPTQQHKLQHNLTNIAGD